MKARGGWAGASLLLFAGSCHPDDPRNHPQNIFQLDKEDGARLDRDRALGGFRTREEFTRAFLERYLEKLEAEQRLRPDAFRREGDRLRPDETPERRGSE